MIEAEGTSTNGTLFILDGLDEVSDLLDPAHSASSILTGLLNRPNIITLRPHALALTFPTLILFIPTK